MLETCTHDIAQLPLVPGDLVSPGDDIEPEEHGQGFRVHFVGLHLGVGDRLQVLGVGKHELDVMGFEQVIEPISAGGALDDCLVRSFQGSEVRQNACGNVREPFLTDALSRLIDCCNETVIFV